MKETEEVYTNQSDPIVQPRQFKEGEIVYERARPSQKLIVSHITDNLYYCKVYEAPSRKPLVYFERDLVPNSPFASRD